jgi:hypothetical protein
MEMLDPEQALEILTGLTRKKGKQVFSLSWDSGGPGGGAGVETVWEWEGLFWPDSDTEGLIGPRKSLKAVLKSGFTAITDATTEVTCESIKAEDLLALLGKHCEEGIVEINEEAWEVGEDGQWRRPPFPPFPHHKTRLGWNDAGGRRALGALLNLGAAALGKLLRAAGRSKRVVAL